MDQSLSALMAGTEQEQKKNDNGLERGVIWGTEPHLLSQGPPDQDSSQTSTSSGFLGLKQKSPFHSENIQYTDNPTQP